MNGGQGYGKGRRVPPGLGGRGESEGEYDEGWSTGLDVEQEEIRLLGQEDGSTTRSPPSTAIRKRRLSVAHLLHLSTPPSSKPRTVPFNDAPSKRKKSSFAPSLSKNHKSNVANKGCFLRREEGHKAYRSICSKLAVHSQLPRFLVDTAAAQLTTLELHWQICMQNYSANFDQGQCVQQGMNSSCRRNLKALAALHRVSRWTRC
ncbi:Putative aminophospholipid-translocase [Rhodotorula toruloides]